MLDAVEAMFILTQHLEGVLNIEWADCCKDR